MRPAVLHPGRAGHPTTTQTSEDCPFPMNPDSAAVHSRQSRDRPGVLALRLQRGARTPNGRVIGETDRETHFVPAREAGPLVAALCGAVLQRDQLEPAVMPAGVPCIACYLEFLHPGQHDIDLPAQRGWREW